MLRTIFATLLVLPACTRARPAVDPAASGWAGCYKIDLGQWVAERPGVRVPEGSRLFRLDPTVAKDWTPTTVVFYEARQLSGPTFGSAAPPTAPVWNRILRPEGGVTLREFDGFAGVFVQLTPDSAGFIASARITSDELYRDASGNASDGVATARGRGVRVRCP